MSITIITGPEKTGKTLIANAFRNNQISNKKGALIIDETTQGDLDVLIEKIMAGGTMPQVVPEKWQTELVFKDDPMIILVGENATKRLSDLELRLPGFAKKFGPVFNIKTSL